jgi:hypothetical protein
MARLYDTPKEQQQPMHALTVNGWFDCAAQMTATGTQKLWISENNAVSQNTRPTDTGNHEMSR